MSRSGSGNRVSVSGNFNVISNTIGPPLFIPSQPSFSQRHYITVKRVPHVRTFQCVNVPTVWRANVPPDFAIATAAKISSTASTGSR